MTPSFEHKTILVSGATRGIGRAVAEVLLERGARVIGTGTGAGPEDLNGNERFEFMQLDMLDPASVERASETVAGLERIDGLVNNAGINKINPVWALEENDWDRLVQVNLKGVFALTRAVAGRMKEQKSGRIVNIASIFGVVSKEQRSIYSATKFGLIGFTRGIALDLGPYNVLVNALSPGFVNTELTKSILKPEQQRELAAAVPLGRFAEPVEIARQVAFLLSEDNTYMTGQNIVVDGGFVSA